MVAGTLIAAALIPLPVPASAGASLEGSITDVDGTPVAWLCIDVWDSNDVAHERRTMEDGSFAFAGLPRGEARLRFNDCRMGQSISYEGGTATAQVPEQGFVFLSLSTCSFDTDHDDDGLDDCLEARHFGTDPLIADTDEDGLNDHDEVREAGTDPFDPDTDNDAFSDGIEVNGGTCLGAPTLDRSDPRDARSTPYATLQYGFVLGPLEPQIVC